MSNTEKFNKTSALSRRNFLLSTTKSLATLAVANTGVYIIGSAFKSLDGSMVAGAKTCTCIGCFNANCGNSGDNGYCDTITIENVVGSCNQFNDICAGQHYLNSCTEGP